MTRNEAILVWLSAHKGRKNMYIKDSLTNKGKLLTMVLIVVLILFALSEKVYGASAIVQSYEESTYIEMRNHRIFEIVRCKIHISIETEPDGTWRNNTSYHGRVQITLVWYNASLCPNGVDILINCPLMAFQYDCVNQTPARPQYVNRTLHSWDPFCWFDFLFKTGDINTKENVRLSTQMEYFVYNGTYPYVEKPSSIDGGIWFLPDLWITIMPDPQQRLQAEMIAEITAIKENLESRLEYLINLLNYIIILFAVSIIVYIATNVYFAARKPKAETELKTT
jgi:hypothetical protein